uniref:Uncharacterized protein n=1 Tax=Candidatus Kentrum sp. LFY TaxID=2126342 RepID=A0A450WRT9_9GAMM|nr:MAG: hypothetical protein BECKLFY1418C_GA0070996_10629 [Candidatus Kentron sp. LFY]
MRGINPFAATGREWLRPLPYPLLIVMPVTGSRRQLAVEIDAALHEVPISKDIVVTTPEDFAWRKDIADP